jgi:hypothetical protein
VARGVVLAVSATLATLAAVAGGVLTLGDDAAPEEPAPHAATFSTTALAGYDTTTASVTRGAFCDAIDDRQVDAVLGQLPDVAAWSNGDSIDVTGSGTTDVVHEFGCSYAVQDVGAARAWVFAPPVDADQAQRLVKCAGKAPGCQVGAGPAFGSPTLALTCTKGDTTRVSYRGLFGDAWLVCEVERRTDAGVDVADVAGRWCVGVLQAAGSAADQ